MTNELELRAKSYIREVNDFPKQGVSFKDISPLLNSTVFHEVISSMGVSAKKIPNVHAIAGLESRGFIIGTALANHLGLPFVMIRKAGKLPPPVVTKNIVTEYSTDVLEMAEGKGNLLIVDDVIALGGTLEAAYELARLAGYQVLGLMAMINLQYLRGPFNTIGGLPVTSFITYDK